MNMTGNTILLASMHETIETNLLAPIQLTAALLPQLMVQPRSAVLNVTWALAMLPAAMMPSYCTRKAAMHSYTQSCASSTWAHLCKSSRSFPAWVQTELQGKGGMTPKAMPLDDYIAETLALLSSSPEAGEIAVERAKPLRFAERGNYDEFYHRYNERWLASQQR